MISDIVQYHTYVTATRSVTCVPFHVSTNSKRTEILLLLYSTCLEKKKLPPTSTFFLSTKIISIPFFRSPEHASVQSVHKTNNFLPSLPPLLHPPQGPTEQLVSPEPEFYITKRDPEEDEFLVSVDYKKGP